MAAGNPRLPNFILLDATTRISDPRNGTATAWALTTAGLTIQVSLVVAAPPRLSHFCVCCPGRDATTFAHAPEVVCSAGDHALIRADFTTGDSESPQHFIYRARGPDGRPSLDLIPDFTGYSRAELLHLPLGFVSSRNHLVIAALSYGTKDSQYYLHTLSSEPRSKWTKKLLQVELPHGLSRKQLVVDHAKVIALGGGLLGWVDLWEGILICDVLEPGAAVSRLVPMPKLLPSNKPLYGQSLPRAIRDVTFSRGYMRCVELEELVELRVRTVPPLPDPWDMDELQDSELAIDPPQEDGEEYVTVGWRLITWYRALTWNCWRKGNRVHSDELGTVSPQLGGSACGLKLPLKDLRVAAPILRGDGDAVYLASALHKRDPTAWIVSVDTRRKSVEELMPCSAKGLYLYDPTYIPYVLTEYLNDKSDGAQVQTQNACHHTPRNFDGSEKKRQRLSQTESEV
ncbi:uncharacterized protein LOC119306677 [Triticum dicoccoides]|uniref:DUF1618 domain-containing protein n=1 Tax=Triticum turgidum subsp. durum TaxID=4567 RepID=A0A9R0XMY2_TRITD|nr:uncharacterized protein LOC119306677 [Triticum dicoccoides]VAI39551.1 unnamed protein product [Triticum turgidum subsp. durum]